MKSPRQSANSPTLSPFQEARQLIGFAKLFRAWTPWPRPTQRPRIKAKLLCAQATLAYPLRSENQIVIENPRAQPFGQGTAD